MSRLSSLFGIFPIPFWYYDSNQASSTETTRSSAGYILNFATSDTTSNSSERPRRILPISTTSETSLFGTDDPGRLGMKIDPLNPI